MYSWLYKGFPRQLGFPSRVTVRSREEMDNLINKYNGKVRIYASVYNYVPDEEHLLKLDKVFFDFDGRDAHTDVSRLVKYLVDHDYMFTYFFSGGGYHLYLFLDTQYHVINKKDCLTNIHNFFQKECDITIDPAVIGDIARIATVPNTYNCRRKRFCIPLLLDDIEESHELISEVAKVQCMSGVVYGSKLFNPEPYDYPSENTIWSDNIAYSFDGETLRIGDDIEELDLHPCVLNMLAIGHSAHIGYRGRFHVITYLRDIGTPFNDCRNIIKKYLTNIHDGKPEWQHCFNKRDIEKIYGNLRYNFVKCEKMKEEGFCPECDFCDRVNWNGSYHKVDIYK